MSIEQPPKFVHIVSKHTIRHDYTSSESEHTVGIINLTPSDLDVLELEYDQHGLLFLKPAQEHEASLIHRLQQSLRQTLNFFPVLAGRISTTPANNNTSTTCFFITCNNVGVDLIHASLVDQGINVAHVQDSNKHVPDQVFDSLFPMAGVHNYDGITQPLLAVQVTELLDGLFIGWAANHVVADGTSFWHFLNTWAKISCNSDSIVHLPTFNRDRLNIDFIGSRSINIHNKHLTFGRNMTTITNHRPLSERVFHFTSESVANLKARANREVENNLVKISSLQAITAHLWLSIIRYRFTMEYSSIQETTLDMFVDVRQRIEPPLSKEYFGNAVFPGVVTLEARKILENGFGWTALQINRMVTSYGSDQIQCYCAEWVEKPKFLKLDSLPRNHFILINSPRFDVYGNNFGWGKPVAMRTGKANRFDGRIKVSGGVNKGSMEIEVCLSAETLCALQIDEEFMKFVSNF